MSLLPYEATFPALGTRATLLTSNPEALLPAVEVVRAELDVFGDMDALGGHPILDDHLGAMLHGTDPLEPVSADAERDARSRTARRLADLLSEEFPGGFLVDLGGVPAVAGESLGDDTELSAA
ncbi:hypothetical protein ACX1DX_13895 [Tessaracoccus sp. Y36]|uniref:hypothetical protein n=1 Tax=Tessaracoccus sp. ZS01 TaxID=1906324 RepID=UPI00096DEF7F|nr:hypothetical protein [Tessaracoccus sp. ZS01]MCG6567000.1 hypothetical protein [Tessaracoccus sp. ZS01]OMG58121.1 hypothetical protein BJN44_05080 [Tessaracoccus sp. ZS01]